MHVLGTVSNVEKRKAGGRMMGRSGWVLDMLATHALLQHLWRQHNDDNTVARIRA